MKVSEGLLLGSLYGSPETVLFYDFLFIPCLYVCVSHSVMSDSLEPMDCSPPASSLSMEFSRQEYWSGLPFPSPLPNPGIKPESPALQADSLPSEPLYLSIG